MSDTIEEPLCWYAARVKYQTEKKIKAWLESKTIEHFIPFRTVVIEYKGKKKQREKPLIPCLIFVCTNYKTALSLPVESGYSISYIRNIETKQIQIIPDKQMQDCMFLLNLSDKTFKIGNANLKKGDRVRVVRGPFMGIEGELVRIKGHKRVVVRLEGVFSLVTTYIPGEYLERIESTNGE
ncbi:transcriptional regulator [Bacteroidia bacterium]|nr:transcriptional regulator [Bacteroidia bacterium]GHT46503.1 transcriptional regulator [Bacteroidia bacterium]